MARIYVGTCSWSDHKHFYPDKLRLAEQIGYYSSRFPVVELNSTFYRMMPARNYELWAQRTPPGFLFDVKPYRQLSWHDRKQPPTLELMTAFRDGMQPLREAGRLGAVHFQFPPWYRHSEENLEFIHRLRDHFGDDRLGVEFRHRSWLEEPQRAAVVAALAEMQVSLTVVDEPQLGAGSVPTVLDVTNPDLLIVRFHGRNYKMWYAKVKTTAERFDYLYSTKELEEWVPQVATLAARANNMHLLFNNNAEDYAIRNAVQLRMLLQEAFSAEQHTVVASEVVNWEPGGGTD